MSTAADDRRHQRPGRGRPRPDEETRQARLEEFHGRLSKHVLSLTSGPAWAAWLQTAARFHHYSFRNTIAIWSQRPDATRVAGYRIWQSMGRQVRKGEEGIEILAPVTRRDEALESGEPGTPGPGSGTRADAAPDPKARRMVGVRIAHVFDVSQTDGDPLPDVQALAPTTLTGDAPSHLWEGLARQVQESGYTLSTDPLDGRQQGRTTFSTRQVQVIPDLEPAQQVKTLAHELGHVLMHDPGLDPRRDQIGTGKSTPRLTLEVTDEIPLVLGRFDSQNAQVTARDHEGRWIGNLILEFPRDGRRDLVAVNVVPQMRRQGVATAMFRHAEHLGLNPTYDSAFFTPDGRAFVDSLRTPTDPPEPARPFCRGQIEVEAESVAFLVTSAHGMDSSAFSFPYVAGWALESKDVEATMRDTASRVLGTAHRILDRLDREDPAPLPVAEDARQHQQIKPTHALPAHPPQGGIPPGSVTPNMGVGR